MNYIELHKDYKENSLFGRYVNLQHITPIIERLKLINKVTVVGKSIQDNPIHQVEIGTGKIKVLIWSQMHGNESTTTKAVFDFINYLNSDDEIAIKILQNYSFRILPMVNPDGAFLYTRENANKIDLNRDADVISQPESKALRIVFDAFQPNFCFNLHDQRTIFGVADSGKPATVSFLAPSYNEKREFNAVRDAAVSLIVEMNNVLQNYIPGQVALFDDGFNINCIGDKFQSLNVPTILFEAGHFQDDYYREISRKMIFIALLSGLSLINENDVVSNKRDVYLQIPQNKVVFYDFIYKNIKINYDNKEFITNFAAQYKEELIDGKLQLNAYIVEVGPLNGRVGHFQYNAHKMLYSDSDQNIPLIDKKADFCLGKDIKFVNGLKK